MKRQFFISYRRVNRPQVNQLADDIKKLGFEVWFDESIPGGQEWWEVILQQIRTCDVFMIALSPEYLDSTPCKLERQYAIAIGKAILPVLISGDVVMSHLEKEIGNIHAIDYRKRNAVAALDLSKAINNLPPSRDLPDPLPSPPEAPGKYLNTLRERIVEHNLSYHDQVELLADLRIALQTSDEPEIEVYPLLERLKSRRDIAVQTIEDIDRMLSSQQKSASASVSPISVSKTINTAPEVSRYEAQGPAPNPMQDLWQKLSPDKTEKGGINWMRWAMWAVVLFFVLYACDAMLVAF